MKHLSLLLSAIWFYFVLATPAEAAAIGALFTAAKGVFAAVTATKIGAFAVRALVALAASAYQRKKAAEKARNAGIEIKQTTKGGTAPQATVIGRALTGGHVVYRNSHGRKNRYYTMVVEVSDVPGVELYRLEIDREYCTLIDETDPDHVQYGKIIDEKRSKKGKPVAWVKYYDGSQQAADPMLVDIYGEDPDRPWTADHIGTGLAYLVFTFYRDADVFSGEPQAREELRNLPFYDPRLDSSVGGEGTHVWGDPSTYSETRNPVVMIYNILRGWALPCGAIWGGEYEAEDLPLSSWVAAMNACDATPEGSNRPRFRAGLEIRFSEEPAAIIEELLASCSAQFVDNGGTAYVQVAEPEPAIATITDGDVLVTSDEEYEPFPSSEAVFSSISVTHPSPGKFWEPTELPLIVNEAWEAEDGERRSGHIQLPAVFNEAQAQQIGDNMLKDARRWVRHKLSLRYSFYWLRPLMTLSWESAYNGYGSKLFEVTEVVHDMYTLSPAIALRERDPDDMAHVPELELPEAISAPVRMFRDARIVPEFAVAPFALSSNDQSRSAGAKASWNADELGNVSGIVIEGRLSGTETAIIKLTDAMPDAGELHISPLLPATNYEFRAIEVSEYSDVEWTDWVPVQTPDVGLSSEDLSDELWAQIDAAGEAAAGTLFGSIALALENDILTSLEGRVDGALEAARIDGAVQEQGLSLSASIEGVQADLTQNYVTAVSQASALASLETSLSAQIGAVSADLSQNYYTLAEVDSAIAAVQTTLQSQIGAVSASLSANYYTAAQTNSAISAQTSSLTTAVGNLTTTVNSVQSSVDGVRGTYGIEINNNGHIRGFGLISDLVDGNVVSQFTVVADEFRVVHSDGGALTTPFTVLGGQTFIKDALIGNAAVGTLQIAGNAVTVPKAQTFTSTRTGNGAWQQCNNMSFTMPQAGQITLTWHGSQFYVPTGTEPGIGVRFLVNGAVVASRITGNNGDTGLENDWPSYAYSASIGAGTHSFRVEWFGGNSNVRLKARTLIAMGTMR